MPTGDKLRAGMKRKAPPVRRISEDARPLSNVEMDIHRSIIQTHAASPEKQRATVSTSHRSVDQQRKMLETQIRNRMMLRHRRPQYSQNVTQAELTGANPVPMTPVTPVPMTPAIAPSTISLTLNRQHSSSLGDSSQSSTSLSSHNDSLLRLSPDARHLFTRSLSQPANLLRPHTMPRPANPARHMSREHRLMLHRLASYMAESRNGQSASQQNQQPPGD